MSRCLPRKMACQYRLWVYMGAIKSSQTLMEINLYLSFQALKYHLSFNSLFCHHSLVFQQTTSAASLSSPHTSNMRLFRILCLVSTVLGASLIPRQSPPTASVTAGPLVYGGTGCPNLSASWVISSDRTGIAIIYDQFGTFIGPGYGVTESRRICMSTIQIKHPSGYQYTVASTDYRGTATLNKAQGIIKTDYSFLGQSGQVSPC